MEAQLDRRGVKVVSHALWYDYGYVTIELIGTLLTTRKLDLNMKCKLVNVCSLFSIPGPQLLSHMWSRDYLGRILSVSHCNLHSETQTQSSFYMWIVCIISPPPGAYTFKYSSVNTEGIRSVFLKCII